MISDLRLGKTASFAAAWLFHLPPNTADRVSALVPSMLQSADSSGVRSVISVGGRRFVFPDAGVEARMHTMQKKTFPSSNRVSMQRVAIGASIQ